VKGSAAKIARALVITALLAIGGLFVAVSRRDVQAPESAAPERAAAFTSAAPAARPPVAPAARPSVVSLERRVIDPSRVYEDSPKEPLVPPVSKLKLEPTTRGVPVTDAPLVPPEIRTVLQPSSRGTVASDAPLVPPEHRE
jgi:hypothetical protein